MARRILALFGAIWLVAGLGGLALGLGFADAIMRLLPPLAIDADALGGAITAFGIGLGVIGVAHLGLASALARARLARVAAILLCGVASAALLSLAAASAASAAREAQLALALIGAALAAAIGAAAYALVAIRLAAELRPGSGS